MQGGWQVMACINAVAIVALVWAARYVCCSVRDAWRGLTGLWATRARGNERAGCGARDAVHQL